MIITSLRLEQRCIENASESIKLITAMGKKKCQEAPFQERTDREALLSGGQLGLGVLVRWGKQGGGKKKILGFFGKKKKNNKKKKKNVALACQG